MHPGEIKFLHYCTGMNTPAHDPAATSAAGMAASLSPFLALSVSTLWHAFARPSCSSMMTPPDFNLG